MKKTVLILLLIIFSLSAFSAIRLKDIAYFRGARDNQLFGIGVVTGLNGTGDSGKVTSELLTNMMKNLNINLQNAFTTKNSAVVFVFADIPAFYKEGMKLDIVVTAAGDSKSLEGGYLIQTPLYGADGQVYAVAQGSVLTGGVEVSTTANLQKRNKVVGFIPHGAIVENEIPASIVSDNTVTVLLRNPDITTAARTALSINAQFGQKLAKAVDPSSVKVKIPDVFSDDLISFLALIEEVEIDPDSKAKIVINEKTGTIVFGGKVKVADFTINYGNFVISVDNGKVGDNDATIYNLVNALKAAGATPQDIIAIIQNLSAAGYLYAELVVM
ncbi:MULTISPECIES: flagellar basal body P-ring protein FlgI [unclassified Marinitoga]|uniref:flagellar basal body P-ring protein FlgI n=1 Tax=unclassified Marinitoga TaxID=2640159 RepID=UPI0006413F89|nr:MULTISPECIES: flagellar basal body P-ring protein FlgI [unclassified Marinitoga]KLO20924.1 flagellar P-ring protein FlgI [Marinitoga sp. 1155]NUV00062.1 flagellar P-ring protein FlgI [Marinitoga sp. 1154]